MKFKLETVRRFYSADEAKKLEALGFSFTETEPEETERGIISTRRKNEDQNIEIEFGTLEELAAFYKKWWPIIINDDPPMIEIYDGYCE